LLKDSININEANGGEDVKESNKLTANELLELVNKANDGDLLM